MPPIPRTILLLLLPVMLWAQASQRYVPITIPMRDGQSLAADLYSTDSTVAKPVILVQTPYNKNYYRVSIFLPQAGGTGFPFDSVHYHYVILDWRGFYGSKDAAVAGYDRGLDGYDAVEWIARQFWCNGKVGTWGPSALGQIQFLTARQHPPHLVSCVPLVKDYKTKYTDYYYGGVFRREHVESLERLGFLTVQAILAQPTYTSLWKWLEGNADYPSEFAVPMLLISGWFDHYPDDVLRAFDDIRLRSATSVRDRHKLMFGPWLHSGVGKAEQGELTFPNATGIVNDETLRFFDHTLRGEANGYDALPAVRYYQMGANEWRSAPGWNYILRRIDTLFLHADRALRHERPADIASGSSFAYDPRDPSPSYGAARFNPFDASVLSGPLDIRQVVESRPDALTFTTDAMTTPYEINGPIRVRLFAASDRTDTDFSIRLCDVHPDGRSIIMTDGIRRMRFRDSYESETLMIPNTVYPVDIELQHLALTLLPGHRLRIVVSSSDYPRFDINLNNGGAMYTAGDTLIAANRIHHDRDHASFITVSTTSGATGTEHVPAPRSALIEGLYPQPAASRLTIRCRPAAPGHIPIGIFDQFGRCVLERTIPAASNGVQSVTLDVSGLPAGLYWCRIDPQGISLRENAAGNDANASRSTVSPMIILR